MKFHFIDEPELEFGGAGRHIDIRHGLAEHGPLDCELATAPESIRVGVVGAAPRRGATPSMDRPLPLWRRCEEIQTDDAIRRVSRFRHERQAL